MRELAPARIRMAFAEWRESIAGSQWSGLSERSRVTKLLYQKGSNHIKNIGPLCVESADCVRSGGGWAEGDLFEITC